MDTDNQSIVKIQPFILWVIGFGKYLFPYLSVSACICVIRGKIRLPILG
jgi:hypothetical protein